MGNEIEIRIKFFSGIDKELNLDNYNPSEGITIKLKGGSRLKTVLKKLGITSISRYAVFRSGTTSSGERIGRWTKLSDGDEISCLKPSGGG